jgi:ribose 5-phosphate isomerase B
MIYISSDHAGFHLKKEIINYLQSRGLEIKEFGCMDGEPIDYPKAAVSACDSYLADFGEDGVNNGDFLILVCGTGIGISIAANKINGIRAGVVTDSYTAEMAKRHNNANAICLGARVTGVGVALSAVEKYLDTTFEGGRHGIRVNQIMELEKRK